ncbi:MAG TPA: response regulator [Candidatus Sulfotelmatobacter sp.]|nr:response regulator [Candidatus Sulfotelmatobacter sp.]
MDEKLNILLVDDQPSKLITYEAALNELGENLIKAHSGMEALEQLLKNDIALVLMDVCMPGMDGFETAEMIHQHPRFESIPIVFVSGICVTDLDRLKGYQHGAVDYLPVPAPPELLRAKVKTLAELHRKTRQLESLNAKITMLQEEERRRIARELHDSVGQLLAAIAMNHAVIAPESHKLSGDGARCLAENAVMVEEVSKQIRTISYLLHPPLLDEAGLSSAVRCYVEGFSKRSKIAVNLQISPELGRLPHEIEISVFRLVQECLTNIHRHSGSLTATIRLIREQAYLTVEITDAGKGISVEPSAQAGVGFLGMRERLRRLGGTLDIRSTNPGARVMAVIPVPRSDLMGDVHVPPTPCISKAPAN